MNTPKTANWIFQKTYWQPNPHPESTHTRSKKTPKKTFHKHVVSILSLTHTRSKKTSKFGIFFSLNILMKHDQQKCGNKKESNIYGGIFFRNYFLAWKRNKKKQPVEWIPVNIVLPILELFAKDQGWCICRKTSQNHNKFFSKLFENLHFVY